MRFSRLTPFLISVLAAVQLWAIDVGSARADARSDYLIQTLRTSDSFRVRAQAALSLGSLRPPSSEVLDALTRALEDEAPAVRSAAATSLGRLEDPAALAALRAARRDANADVRQAVDRAIMNLQRVAAQRGTSGSRTSATASSGCRASSPQGAARYYVGVGAPGSSVRGVTPELLERAREAIACEVGNLAGVELAPADESNAAARRVLQRRHLTGYYIESSIVSVEQTGAGTRIRVSVVVSTYPGRDIRAMLQGSATASGSSSSTERLALEGAIRAALRQLPQLFTAGGGG
jgi:hypothetical protein